MDRRAHLSLLLLPALAAGAERELLLLAGDSIPPYALPEQDSGIEVELLRAALATAGITVRFRYVPLHRVSTDVEAMGADGSTRRLSPPAGGGRFGQAFVRYQPCVLLRDAPTRALNLERLSKMQVLGFQGALEVFGGEYRRWLGDNPRYREINNQRSQMQLLRLGRVDAVVADRLIADWHWRAIGEREPLHCALALHSAPYAPYFRRAVDALAFDAGLARLRASGEYQRILARYGALGAP